VKAKAINFKFELFNARKRGIPCLRVVRNAKTIQIHWGDGSLRDYRRFQDEILAGRLNMELNGAWERRRHEQYSSARLFCGEVNGAAVHVTHALGEELSAIILNHFTAALEHLRENHDGARCAETRRGCRGSALRVVIKSRENIKEMKQCPCCSQPADAYRIKNTRQEFNYSDPSLERSPTEDPEQAYRRGYQQGAHAIVEVLQQHIDPTCSSNCAGSLATGFTIGAIASDRAGTWCATPRRPSNTTPANRSEKSYEIRKE
jgi:hypothetical protein